MGPLLTTDVAGHADTNSATAGQTMAILNWLPLFFKNNYSLESVNSALLARGSLCGVVCDSLGRHHVR